MSAATDYLTNLLREWDLESLASWVWERAIETDSPELIIQQLRERDEYKTRFVGMEQRKAAGLPAITESEYIAYERQAAQLMRNAGMPSGFYDQPDDFANFIGKDVSVTELNQRIADSFTAVSVAPPEVRAAFSDFYGASGASELAAFFLNPDRATPVLQQDLATAQVAGYGRKFGFNLEETQARQAAAAGVTVQEAKSGFSQLNAQRPLFEETVDETEDVTLDEGVQAQFNLSGEAQTKVARRAESRAAKTGGSAQGAVDQQGVRTARTAGR